ncbi:MAG TPA: DoxX family protein [Gemmatimonadota bacterium]|nr:DoxX family protein [Gemmatimonadota bacterium]
MTVAQKKEQATAWRRTAIETSPGKAREVEKPIRRWAGAAGITHAILRIGAGLLFFMHGAPKLLGWFGGMGPDGGSAELLSLMGLAGVLEVFGGLAIALGVFTRPVAAVLALEMLIAYFYAHVPRGTVPYVNGGELALLYACVWVFLAGNGAGPFSVDRALAARKAVNR